jgi:glycosyltransferase involved in cell wall biosynthesis
MTHKWTAISDLTGGFCATNTYCRACKRARVTRVHTYLTYPFVLSWSLLEAMSAGALVVASRTPPVEEVIKDGFNGRLVDFFDIDAWSDVLISALAQPNRYRDICVAARRTIVESYDLRTICLPRQLDFVENP